MGKIDTSQRNYEKNRTAVQKKRKQNGRHTKKKIEHINNQIYVASSQKLEQNLLHST